VVTGGSQFEGSLDKKLVGAYLKNKPEHPKHMMEKRQPLQQMLLGKRNIYMQKTN
jgi:hypothetical protein